MNKYKMISICSLTIVCILIMNLLLPTRTKAEDNESLEVKLSYKDSNVTIDINVNSDVYTGVICKYIEIDDVYAYDDLLDQTRDNGNSLNLNRIENDKYTTLISNVSKRFVVVYVSIGNCNICDYIDCKENGGGRVENIPNKEPSEAVSNEQQIEQGTVENQPVEQKPVEQQPEAQQPETQEPGKQDKNNEKNESINLDEFETIKENEKTDNSANTEKGNELNQNIPSKTETPVVEANNEKEKPTSNSVEPAKVTPVPSKVQIAETTPVPTKAQTVETTPVPTKVQTTNSGAAQVTEPVNTQNSSNNSLSNNKGIVDKDSINMDDFQEIPSNEKVITTSTPDSNMPQTGENDSIKIIGIIIFSIISGVSFYKYKKSSKENIVME